MGISKLAARAFPGSLANLSVAIRSSAVAAKSLFFLNAPLVLEEAERLANTLHQAPVDAALTELWQRAYARPPRDEERQRAETLLSTLGVDISPISSWSGLIQSVFASSEFIYLD